MGGSVSHDVACQLDEGHLLVVADEQEINLRDVVQRTGITQHPDRTCDIDWRCAFAEDRVDEQCDRSGVLRERW